MDRARYFDEAAEFTPILAVDVGEQRFLVETWDEVVGRSLFIRGHRKERQRLRRVREILKRFRLPFDLVVDVGANIGTTSLAAVEFGAKRVIAVEPEPRNFRLLRANVALNGLEQIVTPINVAAGEQDRTSTLYLSPVNSGDHRLQGEEGWDEITVQTRTLEGVLKQSKIDHRDVSLLWLDVQGAELAVLRGARQVLGTPLVFEWAPVLLPDTAELLAFVRRHYSHLQVIGKGKDDPTPAADFVAPAEKTDILALHMTEKRIAGGQSRRWPLPSRRA
jgi:FkbM family methyltransferase